MIANLLLGLFGVIFVLALAEFLLSEEQKNQVTSATLRTWNLLDELAKLSFLSWLRRRKAHWAISATAAILPALFWESGIDTASALILALVGLLTIGVGPPLIAYSVGGRSAVSVFIRSVLVIVLMVLSAIAIQMAVTIWLLPEPDLSAAKGSLHEEAERYVTQILSSTGYRKIMMVGAALYALVGLLSLIILVPLVLIFVARVVLAILEFLVRRIAEHPKGPILAASGLAGAVIAFVKALE
jgi:hypothetical protein